MMQKNYVIRSYSFGYNDETFYISGSLIHSGYSDEAAARGAYAALERASLNQFPLAERDSFFDASTTFLNKVDDFVFDKTGQHLVEDGVLIAETIPVDQLSDEDVITLVQLAHLQAYKLVAFDDEPIFYALWLNGEQAYLMDYDEDAATIVLLESQDALLARLADCGADNDWSPLTGRLEDLSAQPLLLQQLIHSDANLTYDANKLKLRVRRHQAQTYAALNALLRQPWFEVRSFHLADAIQLQKNVYYDS
jgi:hypothetical protein